MATEALTTERLLQRIDEIIEEKSLLKHPFYQKWNEGTLTLDMLRGYAKQYYHQVLAFPTFVSGVHVNGDNVADRQVILENLVEEEQGEDNHPELWLRFCDALGLEREEVIGSEVFPKTQEMIDTYRDVTKDASFTEGLTALYTYESQVPEISKTKINGLKQFYGIDSRQGLQFFLVHQSLDVEHSEVTRNLVAKYAGEDGEQDKALASAESSAGALWTFLDGVYERYC